MFIKKLEGNKYTWTPGFPKLEWMHRTGPIRWMYLCSYGCINNILLENARHQQFIASDH